MLSLKEIKVISFGNLLQLICNPTFNLQRYYRLLGCGMIFLFVIIVEEKILGVIWLTKLTMETIGQFSVNALLKITF